MSCVVWFGLEAVLCVWFGLDECSVLSLHLFGFY